MLEIYSLQFDIIIAFDIPMIYLNKLKKTKVIATAIKTPVQNGWQNSVEMLGYSYIKRSVE